MIRTRRDLADFTAASHSPPKCGAPGGLKCHTDCMVADNRPWLSEWLISSLSWAAAQVRYDLEVYRLDYEAYKNRHIYFVLTSLPEAMLLHQQWSRIINPYTGERATFSYSGSWQIGHDRLRIDGWQSHATGTVAYDGTDQGAQRHNPILTSQKSCHNSWVTMAGKEGTPAEMQLRGGKQNFF